MWNRRRLKARIVCWNAGGNGVKRSVRAIVSLVRFDSKRLVCLSSVAPATREVGASPWRRRWKLVPRNRMLKPRHIDLRVASWLLSLSFSIVTSPSFSYAPTLDAKSIMKIHGARGNFLTEEKVGVSLDRDASRRKRLPCRSFSSDAFTIPRLFSLNSAVPPLDNGILANFQTEERVWISIYTAARSPVSRFDTANSRNRKIPRAESTEELWFTYIGAVPRSRGRFICSR